MTTDTSNEQSDPCLKEAFDWLLRLEAAPEDVDLRRAHDERLAGDARYAEAWRRATHVWDLVGRASAGKGACPPEPGTAAGTSTAPGARRRRARLAAGAALAASVFLAWSPAYLYLTSDHLTGSGEERQVTLADGSVVHLGAGTGISVDYDDGPRRVRLLSGRAFFEVAPNRDRLFVVRSGALEVSVLGTAFDVQRLERLYAVTVQEGDVAVRYDGSDRQRVAPGERLTIDRADGRTRLDPVDPDDVATWRDGRLFVYDRALADVVESLARYYSGRILVLDETLRQRRVTGSYALDDPDAALEALIEPHGGRMLRITPHLIVLYRPRESAP